MPRALFIHLAAALILIRGAAGIGAQPVLNIESGVVLSWPTATGNTYQPQWSPNPSGPWTALGGPTPGDGTTKSLYDPSVSGSRFYQVLETVPGNSIPVNGGFESGSGVSATNWQTAATQPPIRTSAEAHSGSFSMRASLNNTTPAPNEGLLEQFVAAQGGTVTGGLTYDFSFWAKQVSVGPSYVQQYQVQFRNSAGGVVGGSGLVNFNGVIGAWTRVSAPGLVAPRECGGGADFLSLCHGRGSWRPWRGVHRRRRPRLGRRLRHDEYSAGNHAAGCQNQLAHQPRHGVSAPNKDGPGRGDLD
jgi:hypothetical protein